MPKKSKASQEAQAPMHLGLALLVISAAQLMVVLDASIVNVALPSIQKALSFSPANLVWVINAYTLAFGGLLLLGGRTGDLFGRRRMFMIGIVIFTLASFLGGLATTEAWLIAARVLQGLGGAIASPAALSLITSTFPEGPERNKAMGVYAAMSGAGGAIGVLMGGVLTNAFSWRWVLFVNVPIGLLVVFLAPRALHETETRDGKLDLPGAVLGTTGMTLLVYGLIHAGSTSWSDSTTIATLLVGVGLLATFVIFESRSKHALMPLDIFANRNRSGAYLTMLAIGTAMFGMFYFLTLFFQDILGFSPLRAGVSYLPFAIMIMVFATLASKLVGRLGPKPLMLAGTIIGTSGLVWFSRANVHSTYFGNGLGPMLLVAGGMALCFVPLTLTAVSGVKRHEAGIASAILNSGQQIGGSLGLAVLGTVAVTATKGRAVQVVKEFGLKAAPLFKAEPPPANAKLPHALDYAVRSAFMHGYTSAFEVGAAILFGAFVIALVAIRRTPTMPSVQDDEAGEAVPVLAL